MLSVKRLDKMVVQGFGSEVLAIPAAASLAKSMSLGEMAFPLIPQTVCCCVVSFCAATSNLILPF